MLFGDLLLSASDVSATEVGSSYAFVRDNEREVLGLGESAGFLCALAAGGDQMDALTL